MQKYVVTLLVAVLLFFSACDRNTVKPELSELSSSSTDTPFVVPVFTTSSQEEATPESSVGIAPIMDGSSTMIESSTVSNVLSSSQSLNRGVSVIIDLPFSNNTHTMTSSMVPMSSDNMVPPVSQSSNVSSQSSIGNSSSVADLSSEGSISSSSSSESISSVISNSSGVSSSSQSVYSSSSSSIELKTFVFYADKFAGSDEFTALGHSTTWDSCSQVISNDASQGDSSVVHTMTKGGHAYVFDETKDFSNFSGGYLHLQIKTTSDAIIKLEWATHSKDSVFLRSYADLTDEWEKVVIPIDSFNGIDMSVLREAFAIIDVNGEREGIVAIDDIYYSTHGVSTYKNRVENRGYFAIEREPLEILTDSWYGTNFIDSIGRPKFWGNIEPYYTADRSDGERSIAFRIHKGGGYAMLFYAPKDMSYYEGGSLVLDVKSTTTLKTIQLEWDCGGSICVAWVLLDSYRTLNNIWETVSIPLSHFRGIDLRRMMVPFGTHNGGGTVYIDNVRWVK
ncbi:MAG: hypothetical protein OCC49_12710 [Fibrobacterales bacterium]